MLQAVGSKPALLATKLTHRYYKTDRYFEIDCDIHSSYMAGSIVGVLKRYVLTCWYICWEPLLTSSSYK